MKISDNLTTSVVDPKTTKRKYPEARIIVLDDNFNTFEHVANCLVRIIPGISEKKSWLLALEVDREGSAEVWRGPFEQAELYHQQLVIKGLTMSPIEKDIINSKYLVNYFFQRLSDIGTTYTLITDY